MTFTPKCFHCKNGQSKSELGGFGGAKSWKCQKGFQFASDGDSCGTYDEIKEGEK